jgi:hypothetical protein
MPDTEISTKLPRIGLFMSLCSAVLATSCKLTICVEIEGVAIQII